MLELPDKTQTPDVGSGVHEKVNPSAACVLLEVLARHGVTVAFGIPGGLISPVYDALADVPQIRAITTRHEGMASFAAMGHAVATGTPALVLTTGGPGITNAITGIAAAFVEQLPMVVISGDVPRNATTRAAIQDASSNALDAVAMLRTVTRFSARIDGPSAVSGTIEQALRLACGARPGPVFLSVPLDVSSAPARLHRLVPDEPQPPASPNAAACREVALTLEQAHRPLIIAGNGARAAAAELRELAERLAIPVVTTPHSKGVFPDSHPLCLGGIGLGGHPSALRYLEARPDVVLVLGSRLGDYTTNSWALDLGGSSATFQVDRDPWLIGRNYPVTRGIVGDIRAALHSMIANLRPGAIHRRNEARGVERFDDSPASGEPNGLKPSRVLDAFQTAFPNAVWMCDQGEHCAYALHYLRIDGPDQFHSMVGLASMGTGIGLAIGARTGRTDRPVIALCGDGSFTMHAGEVLTCVEHGIDALFLVMNDGRYNMVHHGFRAVYGRAPAGLPSKIADLAGVARDFGAIGVRIESPADLNPARLRKYARQKRPVVFDVRIDPSFALSANSRSAGLKRSRTADTP